MKCEEVETYMVDYIDNLLERSVKEEVDKHLEICEHCRDEMSRYNELLKKMDAEPEASPDETLRINFYHMLHGEIKRHQGEIRKPVNRSVLVFRRLPLSKIAAGFAFFIAGVVVSGLFFTKNGNKNSAELTALKTEVKSMKEMVMLKMLKEESPSDRIQAVSYSDALTEPDQEILDALANTLNNDRNVNVRIAAAYSLSRFSSRREVRDTLLASLNKQTEPIVQVILMNILVDLKETRAIQPMQQIIKDNTTLKEVKDVAQKGVSTLL